MTDIATDNADARSKSYAGTRDSAAPAVPARCTPEDLAAIYQALVHVRPGGQLVKAQRLDLRYLPYFRCLG